MPSTIQSPGEYYSKLCDVIADMRRVVVEYPEESAFQSILLQLEAAEEWTRDGTPPTLEQKGRLNFGLLASKYLDDTDKELAQRIYNIASYIIYWC